MMFRAGQLKTLAASGLRCLFTYFQRGETGADGDLPLRHRGLQRSVSLLMLLIFTHVIATPTFAALRASTGSNAQTRPAPSAADRHNEKLEALAAQLGGRRYFPHPEKGGKEEDATPGPATKQRLKQDLKDTTREVEAELSAQVTHLQTAKAPADAVDAQKRLLKDFQTQREQFEPLLDDDEALLGYLKQYQKPAKTAADFKDLAWRTSKGAPRAPLEDPAALSQRLGKNNATSGQAKAQRRLAAASNIGESLEVTLTPAIRAKAQELGNNPVQIYQWVRNNLSTRPTYGAAQTAQTTFDKRQGSPADIASLLIALLRAANISARYAYGTVEISAERMNNWLGVKRVEAAAELLSQGGIPVTGLVSGGKVSALRFEHVWVEAYVDYLPSRGAKHLQGDTWIPLDASFKQYDETAGMDLKNQVPLDPQSLLTAAMQGAEKNEAEGWVRNLNTAAVQSQLSTYQQQLQAAISAANPNATVGDVLGKRTVRTENTAVLAGTLPYKTIAVGGRFDEVPASLRHQFRYTLYQDAGARAIDSPVWSYQVNTAALAGKTLTLGYIPATPTDEQLLLALLPQPHADGSPIQPSELPSSLPASIRVKSQLRLDGQVVAEGGVFTLGSELAGQGGFTTPDLGGWDLSNDDTHVAGQSSALGVSIHGISSADMQTLKARLEATKAKLDAQDLNGLNGSNIAGDLLSAVAWGYLAGVESEGRLAQRTAGMVEHAGMSYGFVHGLAQPNKVLGYLVTGVSFPGILMDVGHMRYQRWSQLHDKAQWVAYNRMRGQSTSALEHAIPEAFFNDPNATVKQEGISAVKAIAIAMQQGQKVFTITQQNAAAALPQLQRGGVVMNDILAAIAAGKEVTVSEKPIGANGWSGTGYIIIDPDTGGGSYLIEGGAKGGILYGALMGVLSIVGLILTYTGLVAGALPTALLGLIASATAIASIFMYGDACTLLGATLGIIASATFFLTSATAAPLMEELGALVNLSEIRVASYWSALQNVAGCLKS